MSQNSQPPAPKKVEQPGQASRRRFLAGVGGAAAGTAAGTIATPNVSRAQTVNLRFQSTWPARDIFHEFAGDYARTVNALAGGRLRLDMLPSGAVVGPLQLQDAVASGGLDGGHGVTAYWYGKNPAFSLFGTPPALGWKANHMLGWIKYGGGQALYDELVQQVLKLNLVGFLTGPMPSQPLGWFNREITGPDDLRGLRYRTVGLAADLGREMGVAVTIMGAGDVVPALDRGLLDGAEFNNPSSDKALGFQDVAKTYMVGSYHQSAEMFEIIFNRTKFDSLPSELQTILRVAAESCSADMSWKAMDRYSRDLEALKASGVKVVKTPDSVLSAQLAAWDKVIAAKSVDPFFKKVLDSQKDWARRVLTFENEYEVRADLAYQHFFG
ncbi:TRAP transporter substrate-binding protein [Niveispirillum sp.]|uniref:TRAP transporter substrate-binding protein n=1 Tax=Niveispirillum sp. TaxID=1917217 RepID=UPI001B481216|nr:TRAP transporter substrate-binding protein [Niveispirillum sp.]MBP7338390.1 TRAP transporter substrate-binding protein [Niveispirillum sp.]